MAERIVHPCSCDKVAKWGYALWEFKPSENEVWKYREHNRDLNKIIAAAQRYTRVLIGCRGYGQELLREYYPKTSYWLLGKNSIAIYPIAFLCEK